MRWNKKSCFTGLEKREHYISYHVTQELEIEELIKKWLPYVYILRPLSLKQKIEDELRLYLQ